MNEAQYELRVHTPEGEELARVPAIAFERVSYDRRLNAVGKLTARFKNADDTRLDAFVRYALVDVWRRPGGGAWRREDSYLLRNKTIAVGKDGVHVVTLGADHLNVILGGRVVAPGADTDIEVSGYADVAMKDLVAAWVGPEASAENQIADLLVDAYANVGLEVSENPRRKKLLKVLQNIAKASHVDFYMRHQGDGELLFTANRPWGADRRFSANKYTGGDFTLFALERGNMENPTFRWSEADLDGAHASGKGSGEDRQIETVVGGSVYATRFNRRDAAVDAREVEEDDIPGLRAAGKAALNDGSERRELSFNVPADGTGYGETWDLGDWVSARALGAGETFDYKVELVSVQVDAGGEKVKPKFGSV